MNPNIIALSVLLLSFLFSTRETKSCIQQTVNPTFSLYSPFISSKYNADNKFYINDNGTVSYNDNSFTAPVGNDAVNVTASTPMNKANKFYHAMPNNVVYLTGDIIN